MKGIYLAASKALELFIDWGSGTNSRDLRDITVVNLATNIIQTFVISEFRAFHGYEAIGSGPVPVNLVGDAVRVLKELTSYNGGAGSSRINATRLIKSYVLVGDIFLAKKYEATALVARLKEMTERERNAVVTRYDGWRYQSLLEFVEARFKS